MSPKKLTPIELSARVRSRVFSVYDNPNERANQYRFSSPVERSYVVGIFLTSIERALSSRSQKIESLIHTGTVEDTQALLIAESLAHRKDGSSVEPGTFARELSEIVSDCACEILSFHIVQPGIMRLVGQSS